MLTEFKRPKFSEKRQNVILVQDRISKTSKHSLRPALRARRITPWSKNVQLVPNGAIILNFGGGDLPHSLRSVVKSGGILNILNPPDKVAISSNKLRTFEVLQKANVPIVQWTVERDRASEWIKKGNSVLVRTTLASSGGRGIKIAKTDAGLVAAPLYTRYFPKTHEFRVHVVNGKAIDLTEKKLREELKEKRNELSTVRSHGNGWVHAHTDISISVPADIDALNSLAVKAMAAVGLDFGAVDLLACLDNSVPRRLTKFVVCEVNSAPGIENTTTLEAYVKAFNELIAKKVAA